MKLDPRKTRRVAGFAGAIAALALLPLFAVETKSAPPGTCGPLSLTTLVFPAIGGTYGHIKGKVDELTQILVGGIAGIGSLSVPWTQIAPDEAVFKMPPAQQLGPVSVILYCCCFGSYQYTASYVETAPPLMLGPKEFQNGEDIGFYWGGPANDLVFFFVNLDGATFPVHGIPVLGNSAIVQFPSTNQAGLGTTTFTNLPPLPIGLEIHYQGIFYDGVSEILPSNIGKILVNG